MREWTAQVPMTVHLAKGACGKGLFLTDVWLLLACSFFNNAAVAARAAQAVGVQRVLIVDWVGATAHHGRLSGCAAF